jgi:hypothetical protein
MDKNIGPNSTLKKKTPNHPRLFCLLRRFPISWVVKSARQITTSDKHAAAFALLPLHLASWPSSPCSAAACAAIATGRVVHMPPPPVAALLGVWMSATVVMLGSADAQDSGLVGAHGWPSMASGSPRWTESERDRGGRSRNICLLLMGSPQDYEHL